MKRTLVWFTLVSLVSFAGVGHALAADEISTEALDAIRRAATFYSQQVATHGGYVYRYSSDLEKREGEGQTDRDTVWVQPPGTPTVGMAYLDAYRRTKMPLLLDAARAAGECLIRGQLLSGGWSDQIVFEPAQRRRYAFRVDSMQSKRSRNVTTFDDDKTQSALRFLMRLDETLQFQDARVHEAVDYALTSVLRAQFPNGAWPQGFDAPVVGDQFPAKPASYPETWSRHYQKSDYWRYYTFNDNAVADVIDTLLLAADIYNDPRYRTSALKAGEFILWAQMPDPQPAWAQQYDVEMHPAWARKFEPPAITGGESQGVIQILFRLYEESGDRRLLASASRAIAYLERSQLPDGKLARFYELRTNRPLYFTREYELTYNDEDTPTHYGFKVSSRVAELKRRLGELESATEPQLAERRLARRRPNDSRPSVGQVRAVIQALDDRGAWVENGRLRYHGANDPTRRVIESATFARNLELLSRAAHSK